MEKAYYTQFAVAILSKVNSVLKGNVTRFECFPRFEGTGLPPAPVFVLPAVQLLAAGGLQSGSEPR